MHHVAHAVHIDDHAGADVFFFAYLDLFDARRSNAAEKEPSRKYRKKMRLVGHAIFTCDSMALKCLIGKLKTFGGSK